MRAGFGVGAKADTLVFLLGLRGAWASAKVISYATGYSGVAIRVAAGEMAMARLIREVEGRPSEYLAPPGPWAALLELQDPFEEGTESPRPPEWRFWAELFAFLANVMEWSTLSEQQTIVPERVVGSRARDLVDRHSLAFKMNGIAVPTPESFKGSSAALGLLETVQAVSEWAHEKV